MWRTFQLSKEPFSTVKTECFALWQDSMDVEGSGTINAKKNLYFFRLQRNEKLKGHWFTNRNVGCTSPSKSVKLIRGAIPPWRHHSAMCWLAQSCRINGKGSKTKDLVHAGILESAADSVPKLNAWIQWGAKSHDWEVRTKPSSFLMCDYTKAHRKHGWKFTEWPHPEGPDGLGLMCESIYLAVVMQGFCKHETSTTVMHTDW